MNIAENLPRYCYSSPPDIRLVMMLYAWLPLPAGSGEGRFARRSIDFFDRQRGY
jgi:hypothetical protein